MQDTYKWSIAEYHALIEAGLLDDKSVELIRGELLVMPPEGEIHAYRNHAADKYLTRLLQDLAEVRKTSPITLSNGSEPQPDIAVVEPLDRVYLSHHPYPENIFWLIEYAKATLQRDLNLKAQIYAEAGIPEYWVVNVLQNELTVMRLPQNSVYQFQTTYTSGRIFSLAFPQIPIEVDRIINA